MQKSFIPTDNQQERPEDLAYLAGFIDADGCLSVYTKKHYKKIGFVPRVQITNTNEYGVKWVCLLLDKCNIPYYIYTRKHKNPNHNDTYDIMISGFKRCLKIVPRILPYMHLKQDRAKAMIEFCESRLKAGRKKPYSQHEINLCKLISPKKLGILRDYHAEHASA